MRIPIHRLLLALLAAFALLVAACGDDDDPVATSGDAAPSATSASDEDGAEGGFPVTVTSDGIDTTVEARPDAIVSLSPTATEMVFAIGAGDQVVAVDEFSTYPAEAPVTDLSGYEPNLEAVLTYEPDLVLLQGPDDALTGGLEAAGVPSIVLPAATDLDDTYAQLELLGTVTDHVDEAAVVVEEMRDDIDELLAGVPERDEPLTYYHELDELLYSVTSDTFLGQLYTLVGLENIADAAEGAAEAGGYPQLSAEFVIDADPDLIFLADAQCCAQSAETVSARPGWAQMRAVQAGTIIELDEDIASRWGPRVVELLESIVEVTAELDAPTGG